MKLRHRLKPRKRRAKKSCAARSRKKLIARAAVIRRRNADCQSVPHAGRIGNPRARNHSSIKSSHSTRPRRGRSKGNAEQNSILLKLKSHKPKPAAANTAPSFASLDFPGQQMLHPYEIAARIECSAKHIYDLILEGELRAIDISGHRNASDRRTLRVPIESWRQFLSERTL